MEPEVQSPIESEQHGPSRCDAKHEMHRQPEEATSRDPEILRAAVAPLVLGSRNLGWVAISTFPTPGCDGWWRVALLEAIARQATLALHQSRLAELNRLEERRKATLEERNRLAR